ncbi:MAG: acetyl-CoA carboxylase biotin carboxylase subunit [Pseudobdellovibrionaceae bacterium]|nr:acetyl-CoA carboxylase biotin carboxylase subunit [Bdellovibrionales bacterium]USN46888.1 MAG: acetyl-CoA carboxylase biotin carboxylase subunit [Pseudobdellovibrionaceae bacterium]
MFKKLLVANRGEIAIRVIRACRTLGIQTVAVYSDADRNSLHVMLADEAYHIGPAPSAESYLNIDKIIEVAKASGSEVVHPGYGFLSEVEDFAKRLKAEGLVFVGPEPEQIRKMGDKLGAREFMRAAGVPIVPGSDAVQSVDEAKAEAERIGYPIILKASAGGGGKGIRVVEEPKELASAFRACQSEGLNYFKDDRVFLERFITNPKHIEIQVFGDKHGNAVHLFERECSVQRRHQKLIEEAPSVSVPEEVRAAMGEVAVQATKALKYVGAGTIEFIFDNATKEYFFMEMNTRLQVEHPITELITGIDLVHEQLRVAAGMPLSVAQEDIEKHGHAIELRICTEDPLTFAPCPGKIRRCRLPQGPFVRVDSYVYPGYEVPIYYDPMVAKLIAWGHDRNECIRRLQQALAEFMLTGVKSNIVLHKNILAHPMFLDGSYTTQFIDNELKGKKHKELFMFVDENVFLIAAAIEAYNQSRHKDVSQYKVSSRWKNLSRFQQLRV